jgi:hypothetical protein
MVFLRGAAPAALALGLIAGASGCGPSQHAEERRHDDFTRRAKFDLGCSSMDRIDIVSIDARTRGVTGCGRRATYVKICDAHNPHRPFVEPSCQWVLNSGVNPKS